MSSWSHDILSRFKGDPTEVNLEASGINATKADWVAGILKKNRTVTSLILRNNYVADAGAMSLADALKVNSTLQLLDLENNKINDIGAIALADALLVNTTLTALFLANNHGITEAVQNALVDALVAKESFMYVGPGQEKLAQMRQMRQNARNAVIALLMIGSKGRLKRMNTRTINTENLIANVELPTENEIYRTQALLLWETRNDPETWLFDLDARDDDEPKRRRRAHSLACIGCPTGTAAFAEEHDMSRVFCSAYCQFVHYHNLPDLRGMTAAQVQKALIK